MQSEPAPTRKPLRSVQTTAQFPNGTAPGNFCPISSSYPAVKDCPNSAGKLGKRPADQVVREVGSREAH